MGDVIEMSLGISTGMFEAGCKKNGTTNQKIATKTAVLALSHQA